MDKLSKARKLNPIRFSKNVRKIIEEITEVVTNHVLTPELTLRLVTPNCRLWKARWEESPFPEPFWAFYWPGGEALTRYLLDNPSLIREKRVLDLGSGCGSVAIAASLAQTAASVTANDIDPKRSQWGEQMEDFIMSRAHPADKINSVEVPPVRTDAFLDNLFEHG